ncbi:hypothetical protein CRM22_004225 [Opisthorchis felineus]|uniref:Uncharacterized protein n=1 Tax=Opisthorchis felineus TaxID=147828 RepID=A0A4V3SFI3_OPIFE|nr:hypothetical protein CRM22_004225 [Opisthorchis felineus]
MLIKDINIPVNTTEFNLNDINNVKYRLNEQSHLIMALKESADRELLQRKEFEEKLAQERDKSFELQEQTEELELRLMQSQNLVASLSQTIEKLTGRGKRKTCATSDTPIQCNRDSEIATSEKGLNTNSWWMEDVLQNSDLKRKTNELAAALRKAEIEKFELTQKYMTILAERRNANLDFTNSKTLLEENYAQAKRQIEVLQREALENASRWSDERADFEKRICGRMIKEEELNRITQQLQQENSDLQKEIEELNLRRKKDAEALNANKQIKRLNNRLDEADARYKNLQEVFEAYKQHTNELLQAEKKLNKKLRQHFK